MKKFCLAALSIMILTLPVMGAPVIEVPDGGASSLLLGISMAAIAIMRRRVR